MGTIRVGLKGGRAQTFDRGVTLSQVAQALARDEVATAAAARVNGALLDLSAPLYEDAEVELIPIESEEGLSILRHSTSHVMAEAVGQLYPSVKYGIGPAIEDGFYYDFDLPQTLSEEDLGRIEAKMQQIIEQDQPFRRRTMSKEEAKAFFARRGQDWKVELLEGLEDEQPTVYEVGEFFDLCRGPHLPSTGRIKAFKLLSVAGAYWRGDERNKMLQRIYGAAFADGTSLTEYLHRLEEAKRRDHRRLGRELDLFSVHDIAGPGLIMLHPRGAMLRRIVEDFEKDEHLKRGYQMVSTPHLLKADTWVVSGHYENYRENMYFTKIDEVEYGIKPMNCPAHMLIYQSQIRSYRDLPIRYFELGTVYRHEKSGVLHGLLRVRGFTQDDAHIFCLPEQLKDEIKGVLDFALFMMKTFGFQYLITLGTRPEKFIGDEAHWERATSALREALADQGLEYEVAEGDGAFYGPKVDIALKDAIGRAWDGPTIQVDFALPERFDLFYVGSDGNKHRPVMVHRTVLGSMERFLGVLIEHYAGAFPVWLAPIQARILALTERQHPYASRLHDRLRAEGLRVEMDLRNEKIGFKVREAEMLKIPYMLVIGDKEEKEGSLS
ncbi:MAG: threonine--tRNA ligase, partial [candidate division NC10 bacterium]|nr:threonine--tRNA ligase [candidate division NC10 bacterium]